MKHAIGVHMLSLSFPLGSMRDTKNLKKKPFRKKRVPPPGNTATSGVGGS